MDRNNFRLQRVSNCWHLHQQANAESTELPELPTISKMVIYFDILEHDLLGHIWKLKSLSTCKTFSEYVAFVAQSPATQILSV